MPHNPETTSAVVVDRRKRKSGDGKAAAAHQSLIDELEAVFAQRSIGSRADVLRKITDLFVTGSNRFDVEQRALFDDVMGRMVNEIDTSARAAFGNNSRRSATRHPKSAARWRSTIQSKWRVLCSHAPISSTTKR